MFYLNGKCVYEIAGLERLGIKYIDRNSNSTSIKSSFLDFTLISPNIYLRKVNSNCNKKFDSSFVHLFSN